MAWQHTDGIGSLAATVQLALRDPKKHDTLGRAIADVLKELRAAGIKFPTWPLDSVHGAAVVAEESGELIQAALQHHYDGKSVEAMRAEAIQTAAMALRFIVNLDWTRREWARPGEGLHEPTT